MAQQWQLKQKLYYLCFIEIGPPAPPPPTEFSVPLFSVLCCGIGCANKAKMLCVVFVVCVAPLPTKKVKNDTGEFPGMLKILD